MKDHSMQKIAVQYLSNIGAIQEIRSICISEMQNFLRDVSTFCNQKNVLRTEGNFRIDQIDSEPQIPQKKGLLTSDYAKITTAIRYKKNNRYMQVANLEMAICCGYFGLSPNTFHWVIYVRTTSKTADNFDEKLEHIAKENPSSRFYESIKKIDEDTVLFCSSPITEELKVGDAVNDIQAVADFIYSSGKVFDEIWKERAIDNSGEQVSCDDDSQDLTSDSNQKDIMEEPQI